MIGAVLAQASSLESEIAMHPFAVGVIVTVLFGAFTGLAKLFLVQMETRINEKFKAQDDRDDEQDSRLDEIDKELIDYGKHVAVGTREAAEIHAAVKRVEVAMNSHVEKEENITWAKIDDLVGAVNDMRLQNEVELTKLGGRITAVETKMPNGELQKLADAYHALAERDVRGGLSRPRARRTKKR